MQLRPASSGRVSTVALRELCDSLACVVHGGVTSHYVSAPHVCGFDRKLTLFIEKALAGCDRGRRFGGNGRRQLFDLRVQELGWHDPVDETALPGGLGIDEISGQQHLQCRLLEYVARQPHRRGCAEKSEIDARYCKLG